MTDNPYWLVSGLSYEDALKLASADCVENFQRDAQSGETKFWPGNSDVLAYLRDALGPEQNIVAANGVYTVNQRRPKLIATR